MNARIPHDPRCARYHVPERPHCGRLLSEHAGPERRCPDALEGDARVRTFLRHAQTRTRASGSLRGDDARVLHELIARTLRGDDSRVWARSHAAALGRISRIAGAMVGRVERARAEAEAEEGIAAE